MNTRLYITETTVLMFTDTTSLVLKSLRHGPSVEADICFACTQLVLQLNVHKNATPRCMLILSDLFWSITQESDTTLNADRVWSFRVHYTRIRHHALCWSCLIYYTRIWHHAECWSCLIFSDPLHKNPIPRFMLILSDLCRIHYTRICHNALCWSCLIFSDPLHKNPTPL